MEFINIMAAFENEPPDYDYVLPGGFVAGTVGTLVAPGGTGKSFLALQASATVCCPEFDSLKLNIDRAGRVLYLVLEDPRTALLQRLHALGKLMTQPQQRIVDAGLRLAPLLGAGVDLMKVKWRQEILGACEDKTRLIVIDTLSRSHCLDENSNGDMSHFISTLETIAVESGAAILLVHHTSKSMALNGRGDEQQASRGASALTDNPRWQGYVVGMSTEDADCFGIEAGERSWYVRFGVTKKNYSSPFSERWYKRSQGGILVPVELEKKQGKSGKRYV